MFRFSSKFQFLRISAGAAVAALALAAGEASAFVIFLKDGSRIEAKEKPAVQGNKWVFIIPSGNRQSILLTEVDEKKTEEFNKMGLGDAYLLTEDKGKTLQQGSTRKPTLSEYIKTNKKAEIKAGSTPSPEAGEKTERSEKGLVAVATQSKAAQSAAAPAAPAAGSFQIDSVISEAFTRALEGAGVRGARVTPSGAGLRIQAIAETEAQVFAAIGAAARGLKESRASGRALDKVELSLASATGENAGRFHVTPQDAEALLNGKISAAKYFVANVIF